MNTQITVTEPLARDTALQSERCVHAASPQVALPTSELPPPANPPRRHRLWGRVQSLPVRTRAWLNRSLRDGVTYKHLIATLQQKGHAISKQQLSAWVKSGYADWLAEQTAVETKQLHAEAIAAANSRSNKTIRERVREASHFDIALQIHDLVQNCNTQELRKLLADKPENFFRLVRAHAVQERNAIMRDRAAFQLKKDADTSKKTKRAAAPKKIPTRMDIERYKVQLGIVAPEHQPEEYRTTNQPTRSSRHEEALTNPENSTSA
jgi:hypothetical protein